jgi:predicted PurR-regulated permease PerM
MSSPDAPKATPVRVTSQPDDVDPADAQAGRPPDAPITWVAFDPKLLRRGVIMTLLLFAAFLIGQWIFRSLGSFLFLLLLAWLFGIALEPIVGWLSRKGMKRGLATGLAMLTFLVLGVAFFAVFGGLLVNQLVQLIESIPNLIDQAADWASETFNRDIDPNAIAQQFNLTPSQIGSYASNLAGGVLGVLGTTVGVVFQIFTGLLFAFYFSAEGPKIRRTIASWLPVQQQKVFVTVWDITVQKTGAFVVSRLVLAFIASMFMAIFLAFIGVPYWLPLGLFTGIVSQFIPTIGTYLGILLPALVAVFNDPLDVVWIVIFGTVYQQVENYFLSPRISAATLDIHPAFAFASVIIGAALFGALGALIAIPLAAAITSIVQTYGRRYTLIPELQEEDPEKAAKRQEKKTSSDELAADSYAPLKGAGE